ncbi:MAG: family 43 glycosylhydrolase, partial [Actinomycetota bacterium]|nr:family 43 glycosylhydrolase [Actinomycetota bacterium]
MRSGLKARYWRLAAVVPLTVLLGAALQPVGAVAAVAGSYTNPLRPNIPGDGVVESCADPTVFRSQTAGDNHWYMFCTSDPLNDADKTGTDFNFHNIPMMRSLDLVHWTYVGDAFMSLPALADPGAHLWAPEVTYSTTYQKYYLFYVVTDVADASSPEPGCHGDNAIGVATSSSPTGPWTAQPTPVVGPRSNGGSCNYFWTFDPDVLRDVNTTASYLYYGSYYGGIWARPLALTATGAETGAPETQITIANRYEGANVVERGGYYYLFASAANCCNGPLTGYSVFAGRSTNPLGPYVDREGNSLLAGRVGGSPVISMNGNKWIGPGHNTVFSDFSGQWWTIYHAVNRSDPYFDGAVGFTKRPALLDPLDWVGGWPTVRGGLWASAATMPAPAAQPGQTTAYTPTYFTPDQPGSLVASASDEFNGTALNPKWSWVRPPAAGGYGVEGGNFRFNTQAGDLYVDNNTASVLIENAPPGNYLVEAKVQLNLPQEGCCFNYVQAGMVVYADDDNFVKLSHVSIWETRQTEFAKELSPVPAGYPRYGNTVVGPPAEWTYLRIVRRMGPGGERYTAYTSQDGVTWIHGGT